MKKILTIAVAIFTFSAAFSQETENTRIFSIGPTVGFGHTGIRNTDEIDQFKPYWNAGILMNYSTSAHVGFAANILWSREGGQVERSSDGMQDDLTLQYIRVPLKFAYFFGEFKNDFRPKFTIGPSFGFLVDAQDDNENVGRSNVMSSYENFDFGGNASVGFNWKLATNMWLNADLNYYTGFRAIRSNQYNSNFGLNLGVAFGL